MIVQELYIGREKGSPPQRVDNMELAAGLGPVGEAHGGGRRQVGIWSAADRAKLRDIGAESLCGGRFFANIMVDSFDAPIPGGAVMRIGGAVIKALPAGKRCFGEQCGLFRARLPCPLRSSRYAQVLTGGVIRPGDEIIMEGKQ